MKVVEELVKTKIKRTKSEIPPKNSIDKYKNLRYRVKETTIAILLLVVIQYKLLFTNF